MSTKPIAAQETPATEPLLAKRKSAPNKAKAAKKPHSRRGRPANPKLTAPTRRPKSLR